MSQGCLFDVSMMFQGSLRLFQGNFKSVSKKFQGYFKGV